MAEEAKHVTDGGNQEQRPKRARQLAAATKDVNASQQGNGNDIEFQPKRIVGAGVCETGGEDDARQGTDQTGDDEQPEGRLRSSLIPRITCGVRISAHHINATARRHFLQHDSKNRRQDEERDDRPGNWT